MQPQALPEVDALTTRQRAERQAGAVCVSLMKVLGKPRDLYRVSAVQTVDQPLSCQRADRCRRRLGPNRAQLLHRSG